MTFAGKNVLHMLHCAVKSSIFHVKCFFWITRLNSRWLEWFSVYDERFDVLDGYKIQCDTLIELMSKRKFESENDIPCLFIALLVLWCSGFFHNGCNHVNDLYTIYIIWTAFRYNNQTNSGTIPLTLHSIDGRKISVRWSLVTGATTAITDTDSVQ